MIDKLRQEKITYIGAGSHCYRHDVRLYLCFIYCSWSVVEPVLVLRNLLSRHYDFPLLSQSQLLNHTLHLHLTQVALGQQLLLQWVVGLIVLLNGRMKVILILFIIIIIL